MIETRRAYEEAELLRSHEYAEPQLEAGHRLHGGFEVATGIVNMPARKLDLTCTQEDSPAIGDRTS